MKTLNERIITDRRQIRANQVLAQILHIVGKHLCDEDRRQNAMRELSYELGEMLWKAGVEIVTDVDRAEAGLPPRGPEGWTTEELAILEEKRLEVMRRPIFVRAAE